MLAADKADIHMETDIHATEGNECGFGIGEWIPYLTVHYKLTKLQTGESIEGVFMPMSADDDAALRRKPEASWRRYI